MLSRPELAPKTGAEKMSACSKMLPVRILAGARARDISTCDPDLVGANGWASNTVKGTHADDCGEVERCAASSPKRRGISGLWELPTTQSTPGRAASSSGARWA